MIDPGKSTPTPEDLTAYLTLKGWHRQEGGRSASIWSPSVPTEADDWMDSALLVPHVPSAADYADRVSMLVEQLSMLQQRPPDTIRREASLVHFDVAPVRAADPAIDDSIPLQSGLELYSAAKKIVVAAAGATMRRQSHFGRQIPSAAREHAQHVRVGQTERGSYIVPIISRARFGLAESVPEQHLDVQVEESLFDRRVMSTLATALGTLEQLTDPGRPPEGPDLTDAVHEGVSRELCVGLAKALRAPAISDLSIAFQWAPATSPPRGAPASVAFTDDTVDLLDHISESLRVLDLPREDVLYGLVTELRHRPNDAEPRVGVEALIGRRVRTVYMTLTPEQYEVAKECHERSKVLVRGKLRAPTGERASMEVDYFGPDASLIDVGLTGAGTTS